VEAHLTPESQQMLGTAEDAPQPKSRMQQRAHVPKAQKAAQAAAKKTDPNAPPPPDADEVAARAVNSAPLGLNGNTAAKKPAPKNASGEKQRIQGLAGKTEVAEAAKPNPGTPGAGTVASKQDSAPPAEKKRHKLLGIL
jgi:peptidyl-prolyl cis-trans isomerase SurA